MDQVELKATKREVLGKNVRFLRRQGITPIHLFGRDIESLALQCDTDSLQQVLAEAGHSRLINLKLGREKNPRNVVVREVQRGMRPGELLHVDFYQVKMAEVVKVEVPVVLIGEAPALKLKENMLEHEITALTVECLPAKIPASVEVDLTSLTEAEQAIRVKDVELDKDITVLSDPDLILAKIAVRRAEKIEEVFEAEALEVAEEAEGAEGVEAPEAAPASEEEPKEE